MNLSVNAIRDGQHLGETVWICHYNQPDLDKKPLRSVPPTKVLIRDIAELPSNKKVYYSVTFFSPFNSNGSVSSKVISPVDNTGFRSRSGNPLHVFDNEADCITQWNSDLDEHIARYDAKIASVQDVLKEEQRQLKQKKY